MTHEAADFSDMQRMILLLDAAQDALDKAAHMEKIRAHGKQMRQITEQSRATATRKFVAEMAAKYDIDLGA